MIFNFFIYILIFSGLRSEIDYLTEIQPIFDNNCVECHVSINGSGALELDSYEYLMQGDSNNGPVVIPFNADSSLLHRVLLDDSLIVHNEPICCRMPKTASPLHISDQIKIYNWINEGANEYSLHTFESKNDLNITNITIYPNPSNSSFTIQSSINTEDKVQLTIFDVRGKKVKTLSNKFKNTGFISTRWDSKDQNGQRVASGIYFVSLVLNNQNNLKTIINQLIV